MALDKKFDAQSAEKRIYDGWESAGAFKAGAGPAEKIDGAETFSIMIPPPNVTGALHVGHAFNNTLQDILIRWHRMRGFDTLWQPGTDHAGIATQLQVEKMLAAEGLETRAEMGREAFIAKTWEWKEKYGATIINQLKRLGASCDWDRTAFTMDENFHDAVLKVFVDLYNKGLIYRGKRLVNWDPHFETAISDLEVENIEVDGHMWHFKYPLEGGATYEYVEKDEDGNVTLRETRDYISIATTRPETMLGDGAVAVHPDDARYAPIVGKLCEIPVGPKQHRRLIPIITDTYPVMDFGSGAVKITGAHDLNDYGVAKRNNIPMYRLMDTRAAMRSDGAPYAETAARAKAIAEGGDWNEAEIDALNLVPDAYRGLDRFEARKAVVADITAEGLAVMVSADDPRLGRPGFSPAPGKEIPLIPYVENKKIMQPFCDRSRVVMEPMLTDQWYVDAEKLAGPARDAVRDGRVKIMPESGEKVYFHWMENIEPWCISRQLWWGHQIPVWYSLSRKAAIETAIEELTSIGKKGVDVQLVTEQLTNQLQGIERSGTGDIGVICAATIEDARAQAEAEFEEPVRFFDSEKSALAFQNEVPTAGAKGTLFYRDPDVLDTWFSSGLWPIGTLGWPAEGWNDKKYFPTSTLITGQDILFFWVARMMMMQLEVVKDIPFSTVYLHQLVRDERGVKMSKTLGNVIDPLDMIDEFGADAVRFTMTSMAAIGGSLKLSTERVKGYRNFTTKLWNAARFAEMNAVFKNRTATDTPPNASQTLNKWIIGEVAKTRATVDAALTAYRFNDAANSLYSFVWGTFCDWYIEFSKPLLYGEDEAILAETRATMGWALDQCLIMLHPIMPFITEDLWGETGAHKKPLIHTDWPTYQATDLVDKNADQEMNWVIDLIDAIRSARVQMHVPAGLKIPLLQLDLDAAGQTALAGNDAMIKRIARVDSVAKSDALPKGAVTLPVRGGTFALPLADIIDISLETARLTKTLEKLNKEINALTGRLSNPKFTASAPAKVVSESKETLSIRTEEAEKINAALKRLKELG